MADFTLTAENVKASAGGVLFHGTALEDIEAGESLYENLPFAGKFGLAAADGDLPNNNFAGFALNAAFAGQPVTGVSSDPEYEHGFTSANVNDTVILSAAPGKACPDADNATGMYKTVLGIITSATKMNLSPLRSGIITP